MTAAATVHIIDDDDAVRDALQILLATRGMSVRGYASAEAFLSHPPPDGCGCILTDVQMPRITGIELLDLLDTAGIGLPVIVMTGRASREMAAQAVARGAWAFLDKPFGPDQIVQTVQGALDGCAGCA